MKASISGSKTRVDEAETIPDMEYVRHLVAAVYIALTSAMGDEARRDANQTLQLIAESDLIDRNSAEAILCMVRHNRDTEKFDA